jgi:hypothetical protein
VVRAGDYLSEQAMSSVTKEIEAYGEGQRSVLRMLRRHIDNGTLAKLDANTAMRLVAAAIEASLDEIDNAARRSRS